MFANPISSGSFGRPTHDIGDFFQDELPVRTGNAITNALPLSLPGLSTQIRPPCGLDQSTGDREPNAAAASLA